MGHVLGRDASGSGASGSGASGSGASDPIFEGEEAPDRTTRRATLLFQFFLFPLLIVVASVGVFLVFGAIGGSDRRPVEYLDAVMTGGENAQKQAVHQLAAAIVDERRKVNAKTIELGKAFFAEAKFRARLRQAFDDAFDDEKGPERQEALARCLGAVQDPAFADPLARRLTPKVDPAVRRAIVEALGLLDTDAGVPAVIGALADPDDAVRNHAVQALSRHPGEAATAALRNALKDTASNVRLSAAAALALVGDASGKDLVAQLLDPAWVEANVVRVRAGSGPTVDIASAARFRALTNGIRAAYGLRADDLRPKVEALAKNPDVGPDVRAVAQGVLDQWGSPR